MSRAWTVRVGLQAEQGYVEILRWTRMSFGEVQARTYAKLISLAVRALRDGPDALGSKARDEIGPGIRTLHVARSGLKGRHFVVYRVGAAGTVDVLRMLHDSMDLARHLSAANERS